MPLVEIPARKKAAPVRQGPDREGWSIPRAGRWSTPGVQRRRSARIHVDGAFAGVDRGIIPRHRVDWTGSATPTTWLAVFYR